MTQAYPDIPSSTARDICLWLMRRRRRFRVVGQSMMPLLKPGNEVLLDPRAYHSQLPKAGEIVVVNHPDCLDFQLIKRVIQVLPDGCCVIEGDNRSKSTDSRSFGAIEPDNLLGKVTSRFP